MSDMPNIDIRPDHWEIVRDILRKHVPQYAVWAFGSRAKWLAKQYSDLDLAVITDQPLSLTVSAALANDFSESDLLWKVDVVDWATTGESFRHIIDKDKVVVKTPHEIQSTSAKTKSLDAICSLIVDCPHSTPAWTESGFIVLRNQNIKNGKLDLSSPSFTDEEHFLQRNRRATPSAGDIVITREAPMGEVCMVPEGFECCLGQRQVLLRPNPKIADPRYVLYALQSQSVQHQIGWNEGTGSTVSNLRIPVLEALQIPMPPLEHQRAIGRILGELDDKIELNRRMNQTLETMARTLFKSWFLDFDGTPLEDMQESELGLIPKGWRVGTLADLAVLNPETWTMRTRPQEIRYVDLSNTKWGRIESITPYSREEAPSRAQRVLRLNDTIVGTVRPGNGSYALVAENDLTGSTGFAVLRPKRNEYASLVYLAATAPDNIEALASLADGGAYPAVRGEVVAATRVVIADEITVEKFAQATLPLLHKTVENERQSKTLTHLRDTLLPKLISGELRVRDAERIAETA